MHCLNQVLRLLFAVLLAAVAASLQVAPAFSQNESAANPSTALAEAPDPLSDDELEVLVARIALYPDELIAVISEASLYPLQIVEAARFLDKAAKDKNLKPKDTWDGSVISLLNYPEVVTMMSDDLEWTQTLGDALTYQQKDVLIAIQQLRDKAVAAGVIKSDDKVTVVQENDNVVIQSDQPRDDLHSAVRAGDAVRAGLSARSRSPTTPIPIRATIIRRRLFFAAAVTGAVWGAAIDWDNWGVWGGRWDGGDIDIDCNNCFNNRNVNGKVNFNDVDWKNVDRSKINFDKDQFKKVDRSAMRDRVKTDSGNSLRTKAADVKRDRPSTLPRSSGNVADVRKTKIDSVKAKPGNIATAKPGVKNPVRTAPNIDGGGVKQGASGIDRPVGKPRPAAKVDNRPRQPSGLGTVGSGKREQISSKRGGQAMGGGNRGGGRPHGGGVSRGGGRHR